MRTCIPLFYLEAFRPGLFSRCFTLVPLVQQDAAVIQSKREQITEEKPRGQHSLLCTMRAKFINSKRTPRYQLTFRTAAASARSPLQWWSHAVPMASCSRRYFPVLLHRHFPLLTTSTVSPDTFRHNKQTTIEMIVCKSAKTKYLNICTVWRRWYILRFDLFIAWHGDKHGVIMWPSTWPDDSRVQWRLFIAECYSGVHRIYNTNTILTVT